MSDKTIEQRLQELQQEVARLKSKSAIQIFGNEYKTLTNSNIIKYTSFIQNAKVGDKLSTVNGEIKIEADVDYVRISGCCMLNTVAVAGKKIMAIYKNNSTRLNLTAIYSEPYTSTKETIFTLPTMIVKVEKGDTLSLNIQGASGDVFGANGNGQISVLVEEL